MGGRDGRLKDRRQAGYRGVQVELGGLHSAFALTVGSLASILGKGGKRGVGEGNKLAPSGRLPGGSCRLPSPVPAFPKSDQF